MRGDRIDRMAGTTTPAVVALRRGKIAHTVHDLGDDAIPDDGRDFGLAAAAVLDIDPARILKTILVRGQRGLAVAVVPVTTTVDLKAAARALGEKKVAVADPVEAERVTGYVVGGISPLGQRKRLPTVVDASALDHATVHVSGGRRGLEIELSPDDLVAATAATTAVIGRPA